MEAPILHHYPMSPYAEKVRLLLGYKRLAWRSHEVSVTPPRPGLAPILGGFRRTPVLQLGADYVCDTRLIAEVIERIAPTPGLVTGRNATLSALLSGWAEPRVFVMLGVVRFGSRADAEGVLAGSVTPEAFAADRMPFMQPVFNTHAMTLSEWGVVLGLALIPAASEEITKWFLRRRA